MERVKKIKDYAFVHFEDRDHAVKAMRDLDGKDLGGSHIEVSFIFFFPLFLSKNILTYHHYLSFTPRMNIGHQPIM